MFDYVLITKCEVGMSERLEWNWKSINNIVNCDLEL
jgi:hypothetical protein